MWTAALLFEPQISDKTFLIPLLPSFQKHRRNSVRTELVVSQAAVASSARFLVVKMGKTSGAADGNVGLCPGFLL